MASPTAIKVLTSRLERQLDEPNINFDPLIDSGRDGPSAQHAGVPLIAGAYRLSLRVWLQDLERVTPAQRQGRPSNEALTASGLSVEALRTGNSN